MHSAILECQPFGLEDASSEMGSFDSIRLCWPYDEAGSLYNGLGREVAENTINRE
jgi:hypothetical protein